MFGTLIAITFTGGVILAGDAIIGFLPTESFPGVCSASITAATEEQCRQADGGATAIWTPHADMQTNVSPATVTVRRPFFNEDADATPLLPIAINV